MRHTFLFSYFFCIVAATSNSRKLTDCLKPWQKPIMSVATINEPAAPLRCHPETNPCPQNIVSVECQFSFRSFIYVCCEDRDDIRAPVCPRYHDTLDTFCGGINRAACPSGYKCLKSRYDAKIELCCRPNPRKIHPEPETSFVDHSITPIVIPKAPKHLLTIGYNGKNFTIGQLVSNEALHDLSEQPQLYITSMELDDEKLYTVIFFDMSTEGAATVLWFAPDVTANSGQLELSEKRKNTIAYRKPSGTEPPFGTHIVVALVFQQKENWSEKDLKKVNMKEKVDIKKWLKSSSEIIIRTPIAGTVFGFTSSKDDEVDLEEKTSTDVWL